MREPPERAPGRSRGGWGSKAHVSCDSHGFIVSVHVTVGQRHESKASEPTMARRLFRRRRGTRGWPKRLAGDKGYSYPRIRRWCKRRRVEAVIPTRKNQPRDEDFDRATYKRRNIVERAIGRYKGCRRLGARYEKLAINYVAMWLVAIIEKALKRLLPDTA
jgi:transposase